MSLLSKATSGVMEKPILALIYALSKVGKTTFAGSAPDCLFLDFEDGSEHLPVTRLGSEDLPSYESTVSLLHEILEAPSIPYNSIALDSADRLELRIHERVCRDHKVHAIEDIGYSKGYIHALPYWTEILGLLRQIQQKHRTHIMILGHANVKKFQDPYLNEAYDRYEIKLHHKAADVVKESVDMILFMRNDVAIKKEGKGQNAKAKAFNVDEVVMHTRQEPAFDAGSRVTLPSSFVIPEQGGFSVLQAHVNNAKGQTAEDLMKLCQEAAKKVVSDETREAITTHLEKNKDNKANLRASLERIYETIRGQ